ncbi:cytochrome P450 [Rhodococcus fascians]|nr:cytochrome P450 [Rhodococcus fascians]MBY4140910.1 cytochrome P450 [Rhodococcus fascians]MBY4219574.1 cytochrome P450 [Rhodococcus fascians]MBY4221883.1 cytochrome P450 [Rhodococcus fascians]MBY4233884.1 cytochrome P450 [Rhodococcus fascians]
MSSDVTETSSEHKKCPIAFDRHAPGYREKFEEITDELHAKCPIAWTTDYDGHWVASDMPELFEVARRSDVLSNDNDYEGKREGYVGISIPSSPNRESRGGFLELDPPVQLDYRKALNPFLSPAAVARWIPVIDELVRACIDEHIESGSIDFIDDLANIVPAVVTMGLLGMPMDDYERYVEPVHASVYTPPDSPDLTAVLERFGQALGHLSDRVLEMKDAEDPRPGLVVGLLRTPIGGDLISHKEVMETLSLLIGGGFDTTTALTAHALEWLSENPAERTRLRENLDTMLDSATEEFLRFYTPAPGDGRTFNQDVEIAGAKFEEGDRIWLSWAMANRNADIFPNPHEIDLERSGNRHASFGLGGHRCIGSNVARNLFKRMLTQVLDRIPDFKCDPEGTVHYGTVGVINGMKNLPATFTPGKRLGPGLSETIERLQILVDEQRLGERVGKNT